MLLLPSLLLLVVESAVLSGMKASSTMPILATPPICRDVDSNRRDRRKYESAERAGEKLISKLV